MIYRKGFTLVELLVVIAIIGLLASIVTVSLSTVQMRTRNTKRVADLVQIQKALEVYKLTNGSYPVSGGWLADVTGSPACGSGWLTGTTNWLPGLVPTFYTTLPQDPNYDSANCRVYTFYSNGTHYKVMAYTTVEGGSVPQGQPYSRMSANCGAIPGWWPVGGQTVYAVYSSSNATDGTNPGCW